jgi:hypothetical protein
MPGGVAHHLKKLKETHKREEKKRNTRLQM